MCLRGSWPETLKPDLMGGNDCTSFTLQSLTGKCDSILGVAKNAAAFVLSCLIGLLWTDNVYAAYPEPISPGAYSGRRGTSEGVDRYAETLGWIKKYARELEKTRGSKSPEIVAPLKQLQEDATFLQSKWLEWARRHPGQSPYANLPDIKWDPYYRAVQGAQTQLEKLQKKNDADRVLIEEVAADLHAKAENCRNSKDGLGNEIKVTVRTKSGAQEIPGYEIWCAPAALVRFENEHIRFPGLSSPAILKNLPPGYYKMWAKKGKDKTEITPVTIGGKGEKEFPPIELSVIPGA